jgi:cyclopropane fatty-acyl-phospholipid synthase-like methyltransferase
MQNKKCNCKYMHKWEKVYQEDKFSIKTSKPSLVVEMVVKDLKDEANVLDLGCGSGRNSIYLAQKGFYVDAVDVADLDFLSNASMDIRKRIVFTKRKVTAKFSKKKYGLVIATRLFQYLKEDEIKKVFSSVWQALEGEGIFVSNYNMAGGIFDQENIQVEKHSYPIETIEKWLCESGFRKINILNGSSNSKYVPYDAPVKTFDIVAYK